MAFAPRHYHRFPIFGPIRYEVLFREGFQNGFRTGYGTVTNISPRGWRIYGNVPVSVGDVCSLKVRISVRQWATVAAGKVRWVRGEECGIETLVMNKESEERLNAYILERVRAL